MDDIHRAGYSLLSRDQFRQDVLAAKALGIRVRLASQLTEALHPKIVAEASNIIVLGCSPRAEEKMTGLGLTSPSASEATRLMGPAQHRTDMIVRSQFGKSRGAVEDKVSLSTSSEGAWVIASSMTDVSFRTLLAERIGMSKALKLLAEKYPTGTAAQSIENTAIAIARTDPDKRTFDVLDDVMEELIADMIALAD
jgi:intracellular multiplication protein IcmB